MVQRSHFKSFSNQPAVSTGLKLPVFTCNLHLSEITMGSIPCLRTVNVKYLASEVTPRLHRSRCTENLYNSNP